MSEFVYEKLSLHDVYRRWFIYHPAWRMQPNYELGTSLNHDLWLYHGGFDPPMSWFWRKPGE